MFRRFFADSDIDARPAMDEDEMMDREPVIEREVFVEKERPSRMKSVNKDELDSGAESESDFGLYNHKHGHFLKTLIISIVVFVIVLILAMYLYHLIQKSALHSKLNQITSSLIGPEPTLIPTSGLAAPGSMFPSSLFPSTTAAASGPPVTVMNAQHTLMTPKSAVSGQVSGSVPFGPMSGSYGSKAPESPVQAMGHNRVHFYYDGETSKQSRDLYREYCKLRKYCNRKEYRQQYGPVMFHKWDVSKPEGQNYFSQINLSGAQAKRNFPFCTYGRKGAFEESPLGGPKASSKDMLNQMVQNQQVEKASQ